MATAAELKARLLKHASNTKPSGAAVKTVSPETPAPATPDASGSITVTTDLQPTTLVVVERPAEQGVSDKSTASDDEPSTNLDITNPTHQEFLQRLADVETALLNRDPLMKTHLGAIHKAMMQYEEIANLLRPHEIAKIMSAQQAHTGIVLRAETVGKTKAAASKKAAQLGLNDV